MKNTDKEKIQIINSLKSVVQIMSDCEGEYRILGSILIVAHLDKVFRHIGDILPKYFSYKFLKFKTYGNISVYVFGIKLPFLYDIFSFIYNIYGAVRVLFGYKYETW